MHEPAIVPAQAQLTHGDDQNGSGSDGSSDLKNSDELINKIYEYVSIQNSFFFIIKIFENPHMTLLILINVSPFFFRLLIWLKVKKILKKEK